MMSMLLSSMICYVPLAVGEGRTLMNGAASELTVHAFFHSKMGHSLTSKYRMTLALFSNQETGLQSPLPYHSLPHMKWFANLAIFSTTTCYVLGALSFVTQADIQSTKIAHLFFDVSLCGTCPR